MTDFAAKLADLLKLTPRILGGVALATGFLLFAASTLLSTIGVAKAVDDLRAGFGIAFVLSACLLLSHLVHALWPVVLKRFRARATAKRRIARLGKLTPHEKAILSEFIANRTRTRPFSIEDGAVAGLMLEDILYRPTDLGTIRSFDFNIQPWAWDHLTSNPDLLHGAVGENGA